MKPRFAESYGAVAFAECVADDLEIPCGKGFRELAGLKAGETVPEGPSLRRREWVPGGGVGRAPT